MLYEIVFRGLTVDRDDVEDALIEEFAAESQEPVTGAGTGTGGCHLDLELPDDLIEDAAIERIQRVLAELDVLDVARIIPRP
ncbi:hypothetical protein EDD29_5424 [Actinocorallia herbida]|uniref:Uncharacterized protein n=1 Tax=Actinocorallia herbida TaxID=58109 RepID=A0A3N1D2M1_9ACTN|nr:hypothetical protein [Actinocorallia herbida]ROO87785.1 hypothetical protein EDD29_5424 [Actinocorallia herbida]